MTQLLVDALPNTLEARIHALLQALCDLHLTVATAESCTGGLLASVLTDVEGLGHAFECAYVTYTDEAKVRALGVGTDLLEAEGAVSRPVAEAMAQGALQRSGADIAVAITGFAGPAGDDDEEGRVHLALARPGVATDHRGCHFGTVGRGAVRIGALEVAVELLETAVRSLQAAGRDRTSQSIDSA